MSIEFAGFDDQDGIAQQRQLFENAFPEHVGTLTASVDHYRWKFHRSPSRPHSYEYVAIEDGRILGYYAAIPYPYQIGGRRLLVGMVCDVMTHSDARGRGVFTELGRFALSSLEATDLAFVTGYPIRPEVMGGHLRAGWQVAFALPMYLMPLRADSMLASKGVRWLAPVANLAIAAVRATLRLRRASPEYTCVSGPSAELLHVPDFETFLDRWSISVANHLVKSPEFYDWRLGAPGADYEAFMVRRNDEIVAVAVARRTGSQGVPSVAPLDLMVLKTHEGALRLLYDEIQRNARRAGAEAITTMMSRTRARDYRLVRSGFVRSPFTFRLIVRSVSDELAVEEISHERDWHLMWIDSDDL